MWTQQSSLSKQLCFFPGRELCLMALCLPEKSGVVFLCWTMREDGGSSSIHHLISVHEAEAVRAALCCCASVYVDEIMYSCPLLLFNIPWPPRWCSARCSISGTNVTVTVRTKERPFLQLILRVACLPVIISVGHWHSKPQILTGSLTEASHFHSDSPEHEKGWSSRFSNGVE